MTNSSSEELYRRFVSAGDVAALAQVFDRLAPDLARLARQLVGDRHRAEDLVQETFLVAIEQRESFDESRSLQPWLVGILVNRARSVRRAGERSIDAERLVEREVLTPHAEATQSESRQALELAVAELPSKLRAVVEAKLAGRDSGELASELGLSQGALRARMFRGMQLIRNSLPAGLASAFAVAFLHSTGLAKTRARVLGEASKHPAAKGTVSWAAGIWMTKSGVAALMLGVVGLGVALGFQILSTERNGDLPVETANGETQFPLAAMNELGKQVEGGSRREVVPANTPVILEEVVTVERKGASLAGVVLDQNGLGVPFAEVMAWNAMPDRSVTIEGEPHLLSRADEYGAFLIEGLGASFAITAKTETLACVQGLKGTRAEGSSAGGLEITVAPAGTLHGVVRSPSGIPISNAEVWFMSGLNESSSRGLTGVDGVTKFRAGEGRTETSENGEFEFNGLPPNSNYLKVKMKPYLIYSEAHNYADGPVNIALDSGLSLRGSVVKADGRPAVGARVRRWPFAGNVQTVDNEVVTDARGEFILTSFVRGQTESLSMSFYSIGVSYDGHEVNVIHEVTPGEQGGEWVTVQLSPEKVIAGQVVDLSGDPVTGVRVWIEGDREIDTGFIQDRRNTWEYSLGLADTFTGNDGRFRFERLYPGEFTVHLVLSEEERLTLEQQVESGVDDLVLVFDRQAARKVVIGGRVTDTLTGEPIQAFEAIAWTTLIESEYSSSARGTIRVFEQAEGEYELAGIDEKEFAVTFKAEGYCDFKTEAREYSVGMNTLDVELSPSRSLTISVVENGTVLRRGGDVRAVRSNGEPLSLEVSESMTSSSVSLNEGKAFLHGLPAEPVTFQIDVPGYDTAWLFLDLTQPYEGEWPIELVQTKLKRLNLLVLNAGTDVDLDEFIERNENLRAGDNARWVWSKMLGTPELFPNTAVKLAIELPDGELHSTHTFTPSIETLPDSRDNGGPVEMKMFALEQRTFGTHGVTQSSHSSPQPWGAITLNVPLEDVRIAAQAEGCQSIELNLDCSSVVEDEIWQAIVLTPLPR